LSLSYRRNIVKCCWGNPTSWNQR